MPPLIMGRDTPLKYCFEKSEKYTDGYNMATELRSMVDTDADVAKVIEVAKGLGANARIERIEFSRSHGEAAVIVSDPLFSYSDPYSIEVLLLGDNGP